MEQSFDMLTFIISLVSFVSGIWAISAHWARRDFSWADYKQKDVCAIAHAGNVVSTMLAASHCALLLIRFDINTENVLGGAQNVAFFIWHIALSMFFIAFHVACHKFVQRYVNKGQG